MGLIEDSIETTVEKLPYQLNIRAYADVDLAMLEPHISTCTTTDYTRKVFSYMFLWGLKSRRVYQHM